MLTRVSMVTICHHTTVSQYYWLCSWCCTFHLENKGHSKLILFQRGKESYSNDLKEWGFILRMHIDKNSEKREKPETTGWAATTRQLDLKEEGMWKVLRTQGSRRGSAGRSFWICGLVCHHSSDSVYSRSFFSIFASTCPSFLLAAMIVLWAQIQSPKACF